MELTIADFETQVKTASIPILHFSIPEMPLSLKAMKDGRELTESEKRRIPVISQMIAASKARASIQYNHPSEPEDMRRMTERIVNITLGPESKDLFTMFKDNPDVKCSAVLKMKPWEDKPYDDWISVQEVEGEDVTMFDGTVVKSNKLRADFKVPVAGTELDPPKDVPVHVKIVVNFGDNVTISPEVYPPARRILEEGLFSDLIIVAANGAEIKGHRSYLAVHSPVLMAAFQAEMEESRTGRLDMSDVSEQGVWAFLRYLYYGDMSGPEEDPEIALQILYTAHKYLVRDLEAEAINCLMKMKNDDFNVEVAFKIFMFVRNLESEPAVHLKTKTIQILIGKMDELQMLQKYRDLFEDSSNAETAMKVFQDFAETKPL